MKLKHYTTSPRLTAYAISCGGIEKMRNTGPVDFWRVELYREHNAYHVRCFRTIEHLNGPDEVIRYWQTAHTLKKARKLFDAWKPQIQADMQTRPLEGLNQ